MKRVRKEDLESLIELFIELNNIQTSEKYRAGNPIQITVNTVYISVRIFVELGGYSHAIVNGFGEKIEEATFGNLKLIKTRHIKKERYDIVDIFIANGYELEN